MFCLEACDIENIPSMLCFMPCLEASEQAVAPVHSQDIPDRQEGEALLGAR
jgi:hypothetical protein